MAVTTMEVPREKNAPPPLSIRHEFRSILIPQQLESMKKSSPNRSNSTLYENALENAYKVALISFSNTYFRQFLKAV